MNTSILEKRSFITDWRYYSKSWHRKFGPKRSIGTKWADVQQGKRLLYRIVVSNNSNAQRIAQGIVNASTEREFIKYFSKVKFLIVPEERVIVSLSTKEDLKSIDFRSRVYPYWGGLKIDTDDSIDGLENFKYIKI